ncbi:MAG: nucleotidyltransferase [Phycisphaerales bacterium]|nr:nucleotidyltransferase [Phycisphaerales bacterium]
MATPPLPHDFSEFLKLLNESGVRYLVVGGHAVGTHGYVRYTGDLDVWVAIDSSNAKRLLEALRKFGFDQPSLTTELFTRDHQIVRMGVPPMRIEVHTSLSGVEFEACYARRQTVCVEGVEMPVIGLEDLRANKAAAGRTKDKLDLENLPD